MNRLLLITFIFSTNLFFAQAIDTTDIFDVDKQSRLVLKPEIVKAINAKIQPNINQKLQKFKTRKKSTQEELDEYKFAKDTIRINSFLEEYDSSYSMATTTVGMNWRSGHYLDEYDNLLNEYYKKALSLLKPEMKKKLINSQRKWLEYYNDEKGFIYDLNFFGNHNSSLYCWGYYIEMMRKRVFFLRDICNRNMHGDETYLD